MTERIIALRPHHIDRFVSWYYEGQQNIEDIFNRPTRVSSKPPSQVYGKSFVRKFKDLYELLVSGGTGEEYILVMNRLDAICHMCTIKKETCSDPDSLSLLNGSGYVMQEMDLREGFLYPLKEFLEKVKQLYPGRNPVRG